MEDFSCALSHILESMGYSQDIIRIRRNFWQLAQVVGNAKLKRTRKIIAGSKAEGITTYFQSDIDHMFLWSDAICTSDISSLPPLPNMTLLHTDTRHAPPGYTRLRLVRNDGAFARDCMWESRFSSESNEVYIASSLFASQNKRNMQNVQDAHTTYGDLTGPAVSVVGEVPGDLVFAIHCYCPELLHAWASRPRHHNWPPADVIQAASSKLAQVVPTGSKGSDDQWREWRFCFIESELTLTHSLNETQLKLYILLKMVAKEILHEICGEISSYIMKNVTYWLSELLSECVFRKEKLFSLLIVALDLLRSAIRENFLPYYMVPERNLLAERLTPSSRLRLNKLIEQLIKEGPRFLLRCPKIRAAMTIQIREPAVLVRYGEARNSIEVLYLLLNLPVRYPRDQYGEEIVISGIFTIVLPEWRMIAMRGIPYEIIIDVCYERIRKVLS